MDVYFYQFLIFYVLPFIICRYFFKILNKWCEKEGDYTSFFYCINGQQYVWAIPFVNIFLAICWFFMYLFTAFPEKQTVIVKIIVKTWNKIFLLEN
jgi:hypothetical protein